MYEYVYASDLSLFFARVLNFPIEESHTWNKHMLTSISLTMGVRERLHTYRSLLQPLLLCYIICPSSMKNNVI